MVFKEEINHLEKMYFKDDYIIKIGDIPIYLLLHILWNKQEKMVV